MIQINMLDPQALVGGRILKADQLAELIRAHDAMAEADEWVRDRKAALAQELEAERCAARDIASREGLAQFAAAIERYAQEADALSLRVMDLVRACLARVLTALPPEQVLHDLIAPVLREIRSDQEITILLHPDRLADLKLAMAQGGGQMVSGTSLTMRTDATIALSDCLLLTEEEVFTVSIPLACDLLCRALSEIVQPGVDHVG